MTLRKQHVLELARAIREKYNALRQYERDREEHLENIFKPVTEPLKQIKNTLVQGEPSSHEIKTTKETPSQQPRNDVPPISEENNSYLDTYWKTCDDYDNAFGPVYDGSQWKLGNKELKFDGQNISLTDAKFKGTSGLYSLLFAKNPKDFTPEDHQNYKQMLELTGVHRNRRGHLKHQSCPTKFNKIIKPLFRSTKRTRGNLKSTLPRSVVGNIRGISENMAYMNKDLVKTKLNSENRPPTTTISTRHYPVNNILQNWTDPNVLVERLKQLDREDEEFCEIIEELRLADIIE